MVALRSRRSKRAVGSFVIQVYILRLVRKKQNKRFQVFTNQCCRDCDELFVRQDWNLYLFSKCLSKLIRRFLRENRNEGRIRKNLIHKSSTFYSLMKYWKRRDMQ